MEAFKGTELEEASKLIETIFTMYEDNLLSNEEREDLLADVVHTIKLEETAGDIQLKSDLIKVADALTMLL